MDESFKHADLAGATPYTGETPEARERNGVRPDYSVTPEPEPEYLNWAMTGSHVFVSADDHGQQFGIMQHQDFTQPWAYGELELQGNYNATWHIGYTNMALHAVQKALKKYTQEQGWNWENLIDIEGDPLGKEGSVPGIGEINPGVKDWRRNEWSDMDMFNHPPNNEIPPDSDYITSLTQHECPECGFKSVDYDEFRQHSLQHVNGGKPAPAPQPYVDEDATFPPHKDKSIMDKTVQRQARKKTADWFSGLRPGSIIMVKPGMLNEDYDLEEFVILGWDEGQNAWMASPDLDELDMSLLDQLHDNMVAEGVETRNPLDSEFMVFRGGKVMWIDADCDTWELYGWVDRTDMEPGDTTIPDNWRTTRRTAEFYGWRTRIPFFLAPNGAFVLGGVGDEHWEIPDDEEVEAGVRAEYDKLRPGEKYIDGAFWRDFQGSVNWDPETGEMSVIWPLDWEVQRPHKWITPEMEKAIRAEARAIFEEQGPATYDDGEKDNSLGKDYRDFAARTAEVAEWVAMPDLNYVLDYNPEDIRDEGWSARYNSDVLGRDHVCEKCYKAGVSWAEAQAFLLEMTGGHEQIVAAIRSATPDKPFFFDFFDGYLGRCTYRIDKGRLASWHESSDVSLHAPIPFIYDIEKDRIFVGHPGERHSDIQGRFTPGGIVEGLYDPKGKVQVRTETDMPYTVSHMVQLWYALHPELEVKSIYLMVGQQKSRLASADIASKVRAAAAADEAAWAAYEALKPFGTVYVVGGAVRDVVLGKVPKDIDLLVQNVPAEDVEEILGELPGRVELTGKQFGVFRYRDEDGNEVEVALPRKESSTGQGHKDFDVQSDPDLPIEEDLERRDFTCNAIAVNLNTGELIDPYEGVFDLKMGKLDVVSAKSFMEDPLRILRALTSMSRHGLEPTERVREMAKDSAYMLNYLPAERIMLELDKMIAGDDPATAVEFAEQTSLLKEILPELHRTIEFDQRNPHHDLLLHDHLKQVLRNMASYTPDTDLRWAALLHDIGKPHSQWLDEDGVGHYYKNEDGHGDDHWNVGADMAEKLMNRLKFPNSRIDRVTHLIRHHMFPAFSGEKGARKFINRVGDDHADDMLTLRQADIADRPRTQNVPIMQHLVEHVREKQQPTALSSLAIDGKDLIAAGMAPGPAMGQTLRYLLDRVVEDPTLNDPHTLLQMAVGFDPKTANILDEIHPSLDEDVFLHAEGALPILKPEIREYVKRKIYKTLEDAGWPDPSEYLRLILTGSLTTYQWSEHSDFDVSLWVDTERFPEWVRADLVALMIEKCEGEDVPGTTHPLQVFVVDTMKHKHLDDLYEKGVRSAYDLDQDEWYVPPDRESAVEVSAVYPEVYRRATDIANKIKLLLRYNKDAVAKYWHIIHKQRRKDMEAGLGNFSASNITYKMLDKEGLMPLIAEATGERIH